MAPELKRSPSLVTVKSKSLPAHTDPIVMRALKVAIVDPVSLKLKNLCQV
jgi:hypothetical protein